MKQTNAPSRVPKRVAKIEMITVVFRPSRISR
jgi:hypothetical protein